MTASQRNLRGRAPALTDVLRAQLSLIAAARKIGAWIAYGYVVVQTVLLASRGVVLGIAISTNEEGTTISVGTSIAEFTDAQGPLDEGRAALLFAAIALNVWGFFWPFKVWRGERPSLRGYHWAMPVDRSLHDLARVTAGAAWLVLIVATVVSAGVIAAAVTGNTAGLSEISPIVWVQVLVAPILPYLAVSAALVRAERPALWIFGTLGLIALASTLATAVAPGSGWDATRILLLRPVGLLTALMGPVWTETVGTGTATASSWIAIFAGWLALGLLGTLLASGLLTRGRSREPSRAVRPADD